MTGGARIAVAVPVGLLGISEMAAAQSGKPRIVDDSEYYILEAQHGQKWAVEDKDLDAKLAELRKKFGGPPNIIHIMFDDTPVGEIGIRFIQKQRGWETPNMNRLADEGINFARMYTEPSCTPSRAAAHVAMSEKHGRIRLHGPCGSPEATRGRNPDESLTMYPTIGIANPIKYAYNGGLGGKGILPGRKGDTFGIGWARTELSGDFVPFLRQRLDTNYDGRSAMKSKGVVVVAVLAFAQGVFGVLRALEWVQIGSDLSKRGVLLLPIIGAMVFARAALVAILAVLYGLVAWGLLARRGWARPLGLTAALVNLILVVPVLLAGETPGRALLAAIVPVILVIYLLAPAGRRALGAGQA